MACVPHLVVAAVLNYLGFISYYLICRLPCRPLECDGARIFLVFNSTLFLNVQIRLNLLNSCSTGPSVSCEILKSLLQLTLLSGYLAD